MQIPPAAPVDSKPLIAELTGTLLANANAAGGWPYYAGKASRLEATSWALLALGGRTAAMDTHRRFFERCRRPDGLLIDAPEAPANYAHNALAALAILQ